MPFLHPRPPLDQDRVAFILAFGKLSMLEICSLIGHDLSEPESPDERVGVFRLKPGSLKLTGLAGIHKFATGLTTVGSDGAGVDEFIRKVAGRVKSIKNLSLSGYALKGDDYETLVEVLLDGFRREGFKKIHLLRPKDGELHADQIVARSSTDVVAFPYRGALCLGLTSYVPEVAGYRARGVAKPIPHSEISLSPRLARCLVNLSGVGPGQTLLDPFCGSGTILAEGLLGSMRCVGIDSRRRLVEEAKLNLRWVSGRGGGSFTLRAGDARELEDVLQGRRVDGVATEPILLPRLSGRLNLAAAKEMIDEAGSVYAQALASIAAAVRPGGRIVVVVPVLQTTEESEIYVGLDGRPLGLVPFQPGLVTFHYPVRLSFESTRWLRRAVYVFVAGR